MKLTEESLNLFNKISFSECKKEDGLIRGFLDAKTGDVFGVQKALQIRRSWVRRVELRKGRRYGEDGLGQGGDLLLSDRAKVQKSSNLIKLLQP